MELTARDKVEEIVAKEAWASEDVSELTEQLTAMGDAPRKFSRILGQLEANSPEIKGTAALKIGIGRYLLCRFSQAIEALSAATDNKERHYFQAMCHKRLHQYDKAAEEFQRAKDRGWDSQEVLLQLIEVQALGGELKLAEKAVVKLEKKIGDTADYFYLRGMIDELLGNTEAAGEAYTQANSIDPEHVGAAFRLAYYCDLHGEEAAAAELYRKCITLSPVHANALLNLAVLYEDAGHYDDAIVCLRRILTANPTHARARLFMRDAEASKTMYYDEDQAKRIARRNAVLDIPVTDFELSVRARNCLKKMNIRTLGDLVNTTEPELLSYKNFGETSLKEIKDMLTAKGLLLGQALEGEGGSGGSLISEPASLESAPSANVENEGVLGTPIERIEFSVRARRALQNLKLATLGDLAAKSEPELMSCRNFGQTSLVEVRQRLSEFGLQLRESN